jgi:hypothetical protein
LNPLKERLWRCVPATRALCCGSSWRAVDGVAKRLMASELALEGFGFAFSSLPFITDLFTTILYATLHDAATAD